MASSSSEPAPPLPAPIYSPPPSQLMYKNRLQEFTSRSGIKFPVYHTVNEGQVHSPKFRSTVWVAEIGYTCQSTFSQKKAAEQDAARLALEGLLQRTRDEGLSLVNQISPFSKSILNEYAAKLHVEPPTYRTVQEQLGGVLPVFITTLVFNGTSYTGDPARLKKEAEQSAAKAAILSIMGDSSAGTRLIELIKSKSIFYDAIKGNGPSLLQPTAVSSTADAAQISLTLDHKDTRVVASVADNNNEAKAKVEFPESSNRLSTCQELEMPKPESSLEANNVSLQPGSVHSIDNSSTSKKRKKNKKKANKKLRLENPSPITGVPPNLGPSRSAVLMNQGPPYTAAMNQVLPYTAVSMSQDPQCTTVPMNQVYAYTSIPMNQTPPFSAYPMIHAPPCTTTPINQVPPCTAASMNQASPRTALPTNQVPSL